MTVKRYDTFELPGKIKRTDEGFIFADPVVTRIGIFEYQQGDGATLRELRLPEEVFDDKSLDSAKLIPITNGHPDGFVTSENVGDLGIGMTGENARRDGDNMRVPIKITKKDGVEAVEAGRLQLSCGYLCEVEMKSGEWKGERYDAIQRKIRHNHLALCDTARAGPEATLRLDAEDAVMVVSDPSTADTRRKETHKMAGNEVTVKLDSGISYQCPPEVAAELEGKRTELAGAVAKRDELQSELDKLNGTHDEVKAELEELKKKDNSDDIKAAVKARTALLDKVRPMVGEEVAKKLDDLEDRELMIEAIKSQRKDFEDKDKEGKPLSDDYVKGRFDTACEHFDASKDRRTSVGAKVVGDGSGREDSEDPNAARAKMIERMDARAKGIDPDKDKK